MKIRELCSGLLSNKVVWVEIPGEGLDWNAIGWNNCLEKIRDLDVTEALKKLLETGNPELIDLIRQAGYVKKSEIEIDRGKAFDIINDAIGDRELDAFLIVDFISANIQSLIKEGKR